MTKSVIMVNTCAIWMYLMWLKCCEGGIKIVFTQKWDIYIVYISYMYLAMFDPFLLCWPHNFFQVTTACHNCHNFRSEIRMCSHN